MVSRVALIPARGGSQRIPRKNIRAFRGVPILTRVVQTLRDTSLFDRIVVSTDDAEIADVAVESGAEVPFQRPAQLADSFTGARPVIQHAVRELALPDSTHVGVFYPTAVLTTVRDIVESAELLAEADCDFVMSVAEFPAPIERALSLDTEQFTSPRDANHTGTRSQDLPRSFYDVGQFYWGRSQSWLSDTPVVAAACRAQVIDAWRVVDIDTPDDWERAEQVYGMLYG